MQPSFPYGNCDCSGISSGLAYIDECAQCVGGTLEILDCPSDCLGTPLGSATLDNCMVCDNDPTNDCIQDCVGIWGGTAEIDACGICNPNYVTPPDFPYGNCDCSGLANGYAVEDACGVCDNDPTNDCIQDCVGIWGGTAEIDACGVCNGTYETLPDFPYGNCDCSGIPYGISEADDCGICGGEGIIEGNCDCEGSVLDLCNICGGDNSICSGCTDLDAGNYDPDATINDGSCITLAIESIELPEDYSLQHSYPNPFNPTTTISFSIPEFGLTTITAYDITGREIEILTNTNLNPGNYSIDWNASSYPSGVYLIRMDSGDFTQTQKVVLIK